LPRWLIKATGDPKREASFGTYNWKTNEPKRFSFDQLTFPACDCCNGHFSQLEGEAKIVVGQLLAHEPIGAKDLNRLLDWLDKIRIGMWLGLIQLEGNPWKIKPSFYIKQRIALHDRSVGICFITGREPGINLLGLETPCFGFAPTTMCFLINQLGLFNSSAIDLCSRRLGFPYFAEAAVRGDGLIEGRMTKGLERILRPIERMGEAPSIPFIYQPIFQRGGPRELYDTEYVQRNSFDFEAGLGAIFLQHSGQVSKYAEDSSLASMPSTSLSLQEVYRIGRRWVYKKLDLHSLYPGMPRNPLGSFARLHQRLLLNYEQEMRL